MELNPIILENDGKKQFVILSYEQFKKIEQILEDYEDLMELRKAKAEDKDSPMYSIEEVEKFLGVNEKKSDE